MTHEPKVQPQTATSSFNGVQNYNVDMGGFGSASGNKNGNALTTSSQLGSGLQNNFNQAQQGLTDAMGQINTPYAAQLQALDNGQNAAYNYQRAQNALQMQNDIGNARAYGSQNGLDNSTMLGGMMGQIASQGNLNDLAARQQALDYSNQLAQNALSDNSSVLNQLYGVQSGLANTANQNMFQGMGAQDQASMFNAGQRQQAGLANQQAQIAQNQMMSQLAGGIIGGAMSLGAIPLAGAAGAFGGAASHIMPSALNIPSAAAFTGSGAMNSPWSQIANNVGGSGYGNQFLGSFLR